eukprot:523117_1
MWQMSDQSVSDIHFDDTPDYKRSKLSRFKANINEYTMILVIMDEFSHCISKVQALNAFSDEFLMKQKQESVSMTLELMNNGNKRRFTSQYTIEGATKAFIASVRS